MKRNKKESALYGLVLTGGKSTRLGCGDKAALKYHGKTQTEFSFDLLSQFCEKVFISNRREQANQPGHKGFPQIHDRKEFSGIGPLGGILSAMTKFPQAAWLVLACDLPFVTPKTIQQLISKRNLKKIATAYRSAHDGLPEPLCAIYEPGHKNHFAGFLKKGIDCPRKILINSDTQLIKLSERKALDNINDPREVEQALKLLGRRDTKSQRHTRRFTYDIQTR